jgi:hypothetical protein
MKTLKNIVICATLLILASCKGFPDAPLGETTAVTEANLSGTWKLTKVVQFDPIAQADGKPNEKFSRFYDLTAVYPDFAKCQVSFTGSTYTITNPSRVPLFLGTGGAWKFSDAVTGRRIDMAGTMVDFGEVYRVSENKLTLVYRRMSAKGDALTNYFYYFSK